MGVGFRGGSQLLPEGFLGGFQGLPGPGQQPFRRIQPGLGLPGPVVDGVELQGLFQPLELLLEFLDGRCLLEQGFLPFLALLPALEGVGQLLGLLEGFQGGG